MLQKDLNEENKEITSKAYDLFKLKSRKQTQNTLLVLVGLLCITVALLSSMLYRQNARLEIAQKNISDMRVMMAVRGKKTDEKIIAFGDTHFGFNKATLTNKAKALLDKDVKVLKENPKMKVRMAGYTSAAGTEDSNQKLSEGRAAAVRAYMIEKGIAPTRIMVIGYGRTKPALYEESPDEINTKEAKANMRVLFEIIVK